LKVITCFSYKGGAGRTTASANIAAALASKTSGYYVDEALNKKVAIIDLDVFSAGTHRVFDIPRYFFNKKNREAICVDQNNKKLVSGLEKFDMCLQDYLTAPHEISPSEFIKTSAITKQDIETFVEMGHVTFFRRSECLNDDFFLFPSRPDPNSEFKVQKFHENSINELLMELERQKYDFVILDGESGSREMANISIRLADIVLMFFRLTLQHVDGTINYSLRKITDSTFPPFHLVPSVVPDVPQNISDNRIYKVDAPGLQELTRNTNITIPDSSNLNDFTRATEYYGTEEMMDYINKQTGNDIAIEKTGPGPGYFWQKGICIHDSLFLKSREQIVAFDPIIYGSNDQCGNDFYLIAKELCKMYQ
jgi:cellulose biosynthesis protein BcsQ